MELSKEDIDVLAHVVVDPNTWVEHALKTVGEWAVIAKVNRWQPAYLAEKDKPDYKNRAARQAIEDAMLIPTQEELDKQDKEIKIQAKMRELAIIELQKTGELPVGYTEDKSDAGIS